MKENRILRLNKSRSAADAAVANAGVAARALVSRTVAGLAVHLDLSNMRRLAEAAASMTDASTRVEGVRHALGAELRSLLRSRLRGDADAEDQRQSVFVRVIERIGSLREAERIEAWVYQIARNAIADFYRRRKLPQLVEFEDAAYANTGEITGNQNRAIGAWLSVMIDGLPEKQRTPLECTRLKAFSQAEIAARLNISLSGAKSRVRRGRRVEGATSGLLGQKGARDEC